MRRKDSPNVVVTVILVTSQVLAKSPMASRTNSFMQLLLALSLVAHPYSRQLTLVASAVTALTRAVNLPAVQVPVVPALPVDLPVLVVPALPADLPVLAVPALVAVAAAVVV